MKCPVLFQRLLGDDDRHDLAFRHLDVREVRDWLGLDKPEVQLVVFDRQSKPVAHEIDVALDRLRGYPNSSDSFRQLGKSPATSIWCNRIIRSNGGREKKAPGPHSGWPVLTEIVRYAN
jgi:hypothetical protein